ncbi:30S ribosomal protein S17 [Endozoicomonas sp. G2_2]|uniref:30S ribosomal protein S17 n=1 Tax=Gammaproteobacteria TaxID=1236 RepID=UPI000C426275|nr:MULTISPECIES: 30S ribosomal protein S17 [Gammaproteobacteria]MAS10694.1 30S ribosomal protein S17 [Salinisphaera sp.]MBO9469431.1 30S ribosomal protein S17 [Endozoicomonas sp. G2_2]|tara:strand:- start:894 stop:1202 length:309 start_codon:yes stop_codon:yes gene_type:complete
MSETSETNNTAADQEKRQRILAGKVVSNAMDKTIVVLIERRMQHPLYGKYVRRSTRLKAHDPENTCQVGDFVEIAEGRPVSRRKAWSLRRVVEKAGEFDTAG